MAPHMNYAAERVMQESLNFQQAEDLHVLELGGRVTRLRTLESHNLEL